MLGLKLISHAFKMLFHDFGLTLRITLLPVLIGYGIAFSLVFLLFGAEVFEAMNGTLNPAEIPQKFFLASVVQLIIILPTFCWSAIAWHRYVLLQERPASLLPGFQWDGIKSYFWVGLKIALAAFVVLIPLVLIVSYFGAVWFINPLAFPLVGIAIVLVFMLSITAAYFRISLVLPAVAIGQQMSLAESWAMTKGYFPTFFVIALLLWGVNWSASLFTGPGLVNWVGFIAVNWLSYALGVSLLTTLYGVCAEKRAL